MELTGGFLPPRGVLEEIGSHVWSQMAKHPDDCLDVVNIENSVRLAHVYPRSWIEMATTTSRRLRGVAEAARWV